MGCSASKEATGENGIPRPTNTTNSKNQQNHPSKTQVESRIRTVESTRSVTLGSCKARYAYMTQRGFYPDDLNKANQDALSINHKFANTKKDAWLSVYDGHGRFGDRCAQFVAKKLPECASKLIQLEKVRAWRKLNEERERNGENADDASPESNDIGNVTLSKEVIHNACVKAHIHCNENLHKTPTIDDSLSGTTSISVFFHGPRSRITVCNVGDSRAVIGKLNNESSSKHLLNHGLRAFPLSRDQTPYRKDERIRVKKSGARILSLDQIEGYEPLPSDHGGLDDNEQDLDLGEEIDEYGDPPRVWAQDGEYPGTAFTRSLGDAIAEDLGVFAEPEIITREVTAQDKIIVLASDGVFEFLTNQSVIDICAKFQDPLEACRAVVAEAYELWLQYEQRTDDITILCIFLDDLIKDDDETNENKTDMESPTHEPREVIKGSTSLKPLRKSTRKNILKDKLNSKSILTSLKNSQTIDLTKLYSEKSASDLEHISYAIEANSHFKNITDQQREEIGKLLISHPVKEGDIIIQEGETEAKYLYMIDSGNFDVCKGDTVVHAYYGSRETNAHASFGELALLKETTRDATVKASTDGHLWLLPKVAFLKVVVDQNEKHLFSWMLHEALRNSGWIAKYDLNESTFEEYEEIVMRFAKEETFEVGDDIIKGREKGDMIYFVANGRGGKLGKR